MLFSAKIHAQDIIVKNDGTEIQAKILEMSPTDIKYKRFDYLDGPTVTLPISEINTIKYPNGKTEILNKSNITTPVIKTTPADIKDGVVKTNYSTGELLCETPYVNGKINGVQKLYYKTGSLISETPFVDGLANGICVVYYQNGEKTNEIPYVNGNITGSFKYFNTRGKLKREWVCLNNVLSYNKSGVLEQFFPYSNGIINGIVKFSMKNGGYLEVPYVNNLMNGTFKGYNKNGVVYYKQEYLYGEKVVNKGEIFAEVTQGLQQGIAYNNMLTNTNSQTVGAYTNVVVNNYTKSSSEAINANNKVLESTTPQINNTYGSNVTKSESEAITNGSKKDGNSQEASICSKQSKNEWYNTKEYQQYMKNQGCNKFAYISEKKLSEIMLSKCRQYLSQAEIDGFEKTISSLTATINGMDDCKTYNYGK